MVKRQRIPVTEVVQSVFGSVRPLTTHEPE